MQLAHQDWLDGVPDSIDDLLCALIDAAREERPDDVGQLLPKLEPLVRDWTMSACARADRLLAKAGTDPSEVWSHVLHRIFERPPANPKDRSPRVAVRAWVKAVALNYVRDQLRRQQRRERQAALPSRPPKRKKREEEAERLAILLEADDAEWCAVHYLARRRYLEDVFRALRSNARITGLELAVEIGLVTEEELNALTEEERIVKERKVTQHAWKLRERTHRVLVECLRDRVGGTSAGDES